MNSSRNMFIIKNMADQGESSCSENKYFSTVAGFHCKTINKMLNFTDTKQKKGGVENGNHIPNVRETIHSSILKQLIELRNHLTFSNPRKCLNYLGMCKPSILCYFFPHLTNCETVSHSTKEYQKSNIHHHVF